MSSQFKFSLMGISGRVLWLLLCAMLLTHVIALLYFSQKTNRTELKVNRDIITQQTMRVIETVLQTQEADRKKVVEAIDVPGIKISIDDKALWKPHIRSNTLWPILIALRKQQPKDIKLSLLIEKDKWLNVFASVVPTSWTLEIFLLSLELIVAIVVILFVWMLNRFSMPLKEFMRVAERMGVDLNSPPITLQGPAVVRDTADAMNRMQKRIQDLIRDRTQMLAAMSHDLRTPITRLKLRTQFLGEDVEEKQKILADLNEMEVMVKETLSFAKDESRIESMVKLDLSSLLESICHNFSDMGKEVHYKGTHQRLLILGRPVALKRAFNNIIDNAIKYAGAAVVSVVSIRDKIHVYIDDRGPGIPENELDRVLSPFYRGEKSRSRNTGGTGLGLAVTQDIIQAHQGEINLKPRQKSGLRVEVILKRFKSNRDNF